MPAIMVSYRRDDSEAITGRIFDRLASSFGKDAVFRDIDNIPVGVDFREYISSILVQTDVLVVVIGRRWVGRSRAGHPRIENELDLVRIEVETALQQQLPVIPVLVGNAQMPSVAELPDSIKPLAFRNAIRVDAGQDFENHIGRLIRGISGNLSEGTTPHLQRKLVRFSRAWRIGIGVAFAALIFGGTLVYRASTDVKQVIEGPRNERVDHAANSPQTEAVIQSGLKDWTLFGYTKSEIPYYVKFDTIRSVGQTRFSVLERSLIDTSLPTRIKDIPDGAYQEDLEVYDCSSNRVWTSEETYYSKSRELLYHYKWADPEFVEGTADPIELAAGSVGATARAIVCDDQMRKPLVTKQQLQEMKFPSLSTTPAGDGDLYYEPVGNNSTGSSISRQVLIISHFTKDKSFLENTGLPKINELTDAKYRFIVTLAQIDCTENKMNTAKIEYYTSNYSFIDILLPDSAHKETDFVEKSPLGLLQRIVCNSNAPG